jgi:anti-sigma regulatory factor (Ser/Thr protein kinase)
LTAAGAASARLQFAFSGAGAEVMPRVESVEAFLIEAGCTVASARNLAVVTEEILTNISRYAWPGGAGGGCTVEVAAVVEAAAVRVSLRSEDDGVAFDPTAAKVPDLDAGLQERSVGGLGIVLIRTMTDTQSYRRVGTRNVFEVTRMCPAISARP